MKTHVTTSLAVVAFVCAATTLAQDSSQKPTVPPSGIAGPSDAGVSAQTSLQFLDFETGTPQVTGPPFPGAYYETPASIACIYGLQPRSNGCNPYKVNANPTGGSRAIAIVDAFDNPNISSDAAVFTAQFGVSPLTSSNFAVVHAPKGAFPPGSCASGTPPTPPPAAHTGWDIEASLDVQWAHAMAPGAQLYLVEAQTNSLLDLFCAVSVANKLLTQNGGKGGEVSMSWGSGEFAAEVLGDPVLTAANVVYFASSGDNPGTGYPSASPNVVSVGGTSLSMDAATGSFKFENTWQGTGGGASLFEPRPAYQNGIASLVGNHRGTPDVAADANPYTGVWVFNSSYLQGPPGGPPPPPAWFIVGGTSLSSPMWAGITNAASRFAASSAALLQQLYSDPEHYFTDVRSGVCGRYMGTLAGEGWDFCSGNGSPRGNRGGEGGDE